MTTSNQGAAACDLSGVTVRVRLPKPDGAPGELRTVASNISLAAGAAVEGFTEGEPYVVKFSRSGKLVLAGGGIGAKSGKCVLYDISNGTRVMITAIMANYLGRKAAEGFMHEFSGWVIFVVATVLFLLLHSFVTYIRKRMGWYQGAGNLDLIPAAKVAQ